MKSTGWIKMYRQAWEWRYSPTEEKRTFTEFEAWLWMICRANHDTGVYGREVIYRGQFTTSRDTLAKQWRWSPSRVRRFLADLSSPVVGENGEVFEAEIELQTNSQRTKITICAYERFQDLRTADEQQTGQPADSERTADGQPAATNKNDKKNKNVKKEKKELLLLPPDGEKPEPSSPHRRIIQYFMDMHEAVFSSKYHFQGGKDAKAIQLLLKTYDEPTLKRLIDRLFASDDPFILKTGKTIGILLSQANKLAQAEEVVYEYRESYDLPPGV